MNKNKKILHFFIYKFSHVLYYKTKVSLQCFIENLDGLADFLAALLVRLNLSYAHLNIH